MANWRNIFSLTVDLVLDFAGTVRCQTGLITEARRPGRERRNRSIILEDRGRNVDDVAVVELESLADGQAGVGIFEIEFRRSCNRTVRRAEIESRIQLVPQRLVIRPQR